MSNETLPQAEYERYAALFADAEKRGRTVNTGDNCSDATYLRRATEDGGRILHRARSAEEVSVAVIGSAGPVTMIVRAGRFVEIY
mgnify:CR=1 FL=1